MSAPLSRKFSLNDLRGARENSRKVPMLTCYDYATARVMEQSGVPMLLVGDSAANVVLGYDTTLPISLEFLAELTSAVRRGAPSALVVADMPFGSYQGSVARGVKNVCRMVQLSGCDCVKIEAAESQLRLIREASDAGVAIFAHLGLRPQAVGVMGGYKFQGRTAEDARGIVILARRMERAGAAALLLEAVPPEVSEAVVASVKIPVIGCGAGPACDGHVVVTHDALLLTDRAPKFVPILGDLSNAMRQYFSEYVRLIEEGRYPAAEHNYTMPENEREQFVSRDRVQSPQAAAPNAAKRV